MFHIAVGNVLDRYGHYRICFSDFEVLLSRSIRYIDVSTVVNFNCVVSCSKISWNHNGYFTVNDWFISYFIILLIPVDYSHVDFSCCVDIDYYCFGFAVSDVLRDNHYFRSCLIDCEFVFGACSRQVFVIAFEVYSHIVVASFKTADSQIAFSFIDECGVVFVIDFNFNESSDVVWSFKSYKFGSTNSDVGTVYFKCCCELINS